MLPLVQRIMDARLGVRLASSITASLCSMSCDIFVALRSGHFAAWSRNQRAIIKNGNSNSASLVRL
jgi:hypothetical protein